MTKKTASHRPPPLGLFQAVIFASFVTRAAGIECDGNDTAGKVKAAIKKLSKKKGGAA